MKIALQSFYGVPSMAERSDPRVIATLAGLLLICVFLSLNYDAADVSAQSEPISPVLKRERLAVMPFLQGKYGTDLTSVLNCPLCQLNYDPALVRPGCDKTLTQYAQEALERRHEEMTIPLNQVVAEYTRISINETKDTPLMISRELGKRINADYIFLGTVWRYIERKGSPLAIESPASVAFAVYLVEVTSGQLLWTETFSETQVSLSENVLQAKEFFDRGGRWLAADELARFGMKEVFKRFPF
jgi:hypothetical protein